MKITKNNNWYEVKVGDVVLDLNGTAFMIIFDEMAGEYLALDLQSSSCKYSDCSIKELLFEIGITKEVYKSENIELILG